MASAFNLQADVVSAYQASSSIVQSILQVSLSDDVHPIVVGYLDDLGSGLGASPHSTEMVRSAVCCHGSATLKKLGLMVGIKPVDTARLLADCAGGVAWLTWQAALMECCPHEEVAFFQQEAARLIGLKSAVVPHTRELVSAIRATAPRLGTVSFPEHYAKLCGAMRQAVFAETDATPPGVAQPPSLPDVVELLVRVAEAYRERKCILVRGQLSIGWIAAVLTWVYREGVEVLAGGRVVQEATLRDGSAGSPPLIAVELCEDDASSLLLDYRIGRDQLIAFLTTSPRKESLASFGVRRSRADQYFVNWLSYTSPVSTLETRALSAAASQLTSGLLRTVCVANEGGGGENGPRVENQGTGKHLADVLRLPSSYSDVHRIREFFAIENESVLLEKATPTSQLRLILQADNADPQQSATVAQGGSTMSSTFLASLEETYGRMIQEMLRLGIRGANECCCTLSGSGPGAWLPSAHENHCGVYHTASLGIELIATCICSLFIEGPTSPRLNMFDMAPLRWAISQAIEQSILTGSALISGADLIKSVLVVAGYSGDYVYGPLIVSSRGQALVLAPLSNMSLSPVTIGRVLAFPGAILHRNQYYERLVVGSCRRTGGKILRAITGVAQENQIPEEAASTIQPSIDGAAQSIEILVRETMTDLQLVVRSRQNDGTVKEHDLWHCISAALTATVLGDCRHDRSCGYTLHPGETILLVGVGTNMSRVALDSKLAIAMVHGKSFDRLLACGVGVNMVIQTSGCMQCAISACKQAGYSYIVG